ncbi:hypothetical protein [Aneurinibacillus thermoaerophilus]|nr:hypothetical protein [Aneurinibacillus thermoaerophilus]
MNYIIMIGSLLISTIPLVIRGKIDKEGIFNCVLIFLFVGLPMLSLMK